MTKTVEIELWSPHKNQLAIADDKARFKVIVCGRRFGKTTYAVNTLIEEALLTPNGLFFYVAPTYRQAKMIAWEMLTKATQKLPKQLVHKVHESELYVLIGNGSKVCIKGGDNPDSLRGVGLNGCVLDEYADMDETLFEKVIRPSLSDKKGWCTFIGTPKGFNHFYYLFTKAQTLPDWKAFHFTVYDSPVIQADEIEKIKAGIPEDTFAQEYLGDFRKHEGLVYKEFDRIRHIFTEKPDSFSEVIAGVDFGFTNPAAIVSIGRDADNHFWVVDEWYKNGKTNPEIVVVAKNLQKTHGINVFYPDAAEPDRIKEMDDAGLYTREVNKDISSGIDRVRELLKTNRLHIAAHCVNLIRELEAYRYPPKRQGNNEKEDPVKENDHALDALRYAMFTHEPGDANLQQSNFGLYGADYS